MVPRRTLRSTPLIQPTTLGVSELTTLFGCPTVRVVTSERRAPSVKRQLSRLVLGVVVAASLLLAAPSPARAGTGFAPEPAQLGSRVSLPPSPSAVTPAAAAPPIALETHSFPFSPLDAALLLMGSAVVTGLAAGALRVLWYRPRPLLVHAAATPVRPWESPVTVWSSDDDDEARSSRA